jgi:SAM-dependent methyltransferase
MFDRILVVHGLEGADALRPLMRQLWRVLAPEGRILVVAPNRTSLWAQLEHSPFGQGRPFSRGQLERILRNAMFEPVHWDCTLHHPPLNGRRLIRTGATWDSVGRRVWPRLAGVHLVEATKSLYAPMPITKGKVAEPVLARA